MRIVGVTTNCAKSLRSSADDENGGISLHGVLPSNRHSRARGNPGLLCAELAWMPAFAGMTETRRALRSADHPGISIFEGGTKDAKGSNDQDSELRALRVLRGENSSQ